MPSSLLMKRNTACPLDKIYAAESGRGKYLKSPKGALGPFQFLPRTAKEYGLKDPNNLSQAANAASRKLQHLLKYYHGNIVKAVAAYNWGEGNLDMFGLDSAPKETQNYIHKILGEYNPYTAEVITRKAPEQPQQKSTTIEQHNTITIHEAKDANASGRAVQQAQLKANNNLFRNLRPVLS
jgi:hypothetical protein